MQKINIIESKQLLVDTIEEIIKKYMENENIDAIFMIQYNQVKLPTIELNIVFSDMKYKEYNFDKLLLDVFQKTGIRIAIYNNCSSNYDIFTKYYRKDIICRELLNSEILYDKTGYYNNLRNETLNNIDDRINLYNNLIQFNPPIKIDEKILVLKNSLK